MVKRRTSKEGINFYSYNERYLSKDISKRREVKRIINANTYEDFKKQSDKAKHTLTRRLTVFLHNNLPIIIDEYHDHVTEKVVTMMRYEEFVDDKVNLPDFLDLGENISEQKQFHVYKLAENQRNSIDFRKN